MKINKISFNNPYLSGDEISYMSSALLKGELSGNKSNSESVINLIKKKYPQSGVFLTPSCTAALEMGILLSGLKPGDEVIMPSFTFSSTANCVEIFGGIPVFCEVDSETMNLDTSRVEQLITSKTRMIIPIDYAGVPCDLDSVTKLARKYNLLVMLDAAQSYGARYKGNPVGENADLICFSFHETKNFTCGEGGALIVNKKSWISRAKIIQEKGTDRTKMVEGLQTKYSWVDIGSSYLLSDILAGMLRAQLQIENEIIGLRSNIFQEYKKAIQPFVKNGLLYDINIPDYAESNYHAYWLIFNNKLIKETFMKEMELRGVPVYISYIPLHTSKMGVNLGYSDEDLPVTKNLAQRLVRLPVYAGLKVDELSYILENLKDVLTNISSDYSGE